MALDSLLALTAALAAAVTAAWALVNSRRPIGDLRKEVARDREAFGSEVTGILKKAHADLADLAEQVEEMIDRARRERARADGRRGGRPPNQPETPPVPVIRTRDEYLSWLERTGRPIPEVERALGL